MICEYRYRDFLFDHFLLEVVGGSFRSRIRCGQKEFQHLAGTVSQIEAVGRVSSCDSDAFLHKAKQVRLYPEMRSSMTFIGNPGNRRAELLACLARLENELEILDKHSCDLTAAHLATACDTLKFEIG